MHLRDYRGGGNGACEGLDGESPTAPKDVGTTTWLEHELKSCGIPVFGRDVWLLEFMEECLDSDLSDARLLKFYCLARETAMSGVPQFADLFRRTNESLLARMSGDLSKCGLDAGGTQELKGAAELMREVASGQLLDQHLLEAFGTSEGKRGDSDDGPLWQTVMYLTRSQILRRMEDARAERSKSNGTQSHDCRSPATLSVRETLRIAEEALRPGISDQKLLALYVLVTTCRETDTGAFDEISKLTTEWLLQRLEAGAPDVALSRNLPGFDYPDDGPKALKAVIKGNLPHVNLLMLYRLSWDYESNGTIWQAIADLCHAQLLRRMSPHPQAGDLAWEEWQRVELTRQLLADR